MRVYLSGRIRNTTDYMERFQRAEMKMKALGHEVFNPTLLSTVYPFLTDDEYLKLDLAILENMDTIYVMPGLEKSEGMQAELRKAKQLGLKIIYESEVEE